MTPQDPLSALQPLREPVGIAWWPPAPGWWVLLLLVCAATAFLTWQQWQRWQAKAYLRHAAKRLASFDKMGPRYHAEVNALLKAVALRSYGPEQVAALNGEAWLAFLDRSGSQAFPPSFATAPYHSQTAMDREALHSAASQWLKSHRPDR
ncbi:MAG: DUF4381 domain-containing protein [Pseudomonadota bacterium]